MESLVDISVGRRQKQVDPAAFKSAMRQLTGGVTVITAGRGQDISGMTVTSFSSLSVEPPSVIVSIGRTASSWPLIEKHGVFGANILTSDQVEVAKRFTRQSGLNGAQRFLGLAWAPSRSGVPLLTNALAAFVCKVDQTIEYHTHFLLIANVLEVDLFAEKNGGLAYWNGQYHTLEGNEDVRILSDVSMPTARALREF